MELRYGTADENVRKRSIRDVILQERQKAEVILQERQKAEKAGASKAEHASLKQRAVSSEELWDGNGKEAGRTQEVRIRVEPSLLCPSRAGELALVYAVNQLAEEGIRAQIFSPVILLPPGTQESVLRELMHQICRVAFELDVGIGQVHAEVTQAVMQPVVVGTAAGSRFCTVYSGNPPCKKTDSGERTEPGEKTDSEEKKTSGGNTDSREKKTSSAKEKVQSRKTEFAGMDIVLAGPVGLEGTSILVSECAEMLQERFPLSILTRMKLPAKEFCILETVEQIFQDTNAAMVSAGDGGFFTGLWRLSGKTGCGLDVDLQTVPILQETIEITNELEINPYAMRSAGSLLIVTQDGESLAEHLLKRGKSAARIGKLIPGRDRILRNGEEIRYLDRPQTDALALWLRNHPV